MPWPAAANDEVKAYTGKSQVDLVAHSMGVSMSLATLQYYNSWASVRKFINIGGGIRGLYSCYYTGYANAYAPTCGSQNVFDSYTFGFFPEGWYYGVWVTKRWTGTGTTSSPAGAVGRPGARTPRGHGDRVARPPRLAMTYA
jgi:pimeloyl-ACP methyl ester carboxylesterase